MTDKASNVASAVAIDIIWNDVISDERWDLGNCPDFWEKLEKIKKLKKDMNPNILSYFEQNDNQYDNS